MTAPAKWTPGDATPAEMATVYRKYVNEGPAGFDLAILASRLRDFLGPVQEEILRICDFSKYHDPRQGGRYGRDMNDTETAGFVRRALRLYDAATYTGLPDPERDVAEMRTVLGELLAILPDSDFHGALRSICGEKVIARARALLDRQARGEGRE
jgi:hypothetical protein